MSWAHTAEDLLNQSDHTDNAGDQSHDRDQFDMLNSSEFGLGTSSPKYGDGSLEELDTSMGEISQSYFQIRHSSSSNESPKRMETSFGAGSPPYRSATRADGEELNFDVRKPSGYQVISPYDSECAVSGDPQGHQQDFSSPFGREKQWPSLQIVCPDPPQYPSPMEDRRLFDSPMGMTGSYPAHPQGSPPYRGSRDRMLGVSAAQRPMSYYPVTPGIPEDNPMSYHKIGPSYSYSPTMRGHAGGGGGGGGYRSGGYGMPMGGRGPLPMMSPARSPAVNRRFMEPIDGYIYQVQFKRAHKNFILAPSAPRNIIPGDFVKVEADRGEDMGIVLSRSLASEFEEVIPTAGYRGRGFSSGQGERKFLFRLANAEERAALVMKVQDEERALEVIRAKVLEQRLPMTILDAEYQFDRHKLTFFFEADRRIDFRELVSELFSLYKTRIWMQQVDTTALGISDAGAELAKATGFLPQRDDKAYMHASQMHRMESSQVASLGSMSGGVGGGYDVGGGYGQQQSSMSQYGGPRSTGQLSADAPPYPGAQPAMGLGLGTEPELALGLGLTGSGGARGGQADFFASTGDASFTSPARGDIGGGLKSSSGGGLFTTGGGIWGASQVTPPQTAPRPGQAPLTSSLGAQPLQSLAPLPSLQTIQPVMSPMQPQTQPSQLLYSPAGAFGQQSQQPHLQQRPGHFAVQQPQQPQYQPASYAPAGPPQRCYPGGFSAMGMVYQGDPQAVPDQNFSSFSGPVAPTRPARGGTGGSELNANAPPWPAPEALQQKPRQARDKPTEETSGAGSPSSGSSAASGSRSTGTGSGSVPSGTGSVGAMEKLQQQHAGGTRTQGEVLDSLLEQDFNFSGI